MKVLVYGAGVIGCYLTHVLCRAGNDVTLLARGDWKRTLETKGLTIRHHLQRKTTLDHPCVIEQMDFSQHYDVVFSAMAYHQVSAVLDDLAAADTNCVVLVGNNLSAGDMETYIETHSKTEKDILFGFQATAGKREKEYAVCERMGAGAMDIGFLDAPAPERLKQVMGQLFANTDYKLRWHDSMENFLKCHAAAILPLCYLAYETGCDFTKTTGKRRRVSMEASAEGYDLLLRLGCAIVPEGDDSYYRPGPKKLVMEFLLFIMSKTVAGELMAAAHCRHAVLEMEAMDTAWSELRAKLPGFPMPGWNALRATMPDWETLRQIYGMGDRSHAGTK